MQDSQGNLHSCWIFTFLPLSVKGKAFPLKCSLASPLVLQPLKKLPYAIVVQSLSCVQYFVTPWTVAHQASLSFTISQSLLKLMTIELMMPSNDLILRHPLLLLPSIFPSIRVFSNESTLCIRWPKYWSFSFSISPSNEYSGLISFRADPVRETQTLPHSGLPGDRAQ